MKTKNLLALVLSMAVVFAFAASCRKEVTEPSPVGPSTFAEILRLTANPNVISTGVTRNSTNISAKFEKLNVGVAGATIFFEIDDAAGNKVDLGFFDGNQAVTSRVTDSTGFAHVNYFGPLSSELTENTTVFITAKTALTGNDFITEVAPIEIVADVTKIKFTVEAFPNVLIASTTAPESVIKAVALSGSTPIVGRNVVFQVLSGSLGEFSDDSRTTVAMTDSTGTATVTYVGPTKNQIKTDVAVYIRARLETNSIESPGETIFADVYIKVIKGS